MPGKTKATKYCDMELRGLGIPPVDYTETGLPKADMAVVKVLVGDPNNNKYGYAYEFFKYFSITSKITRQRTNGY
jgi:hypothetical protein